MKYKILTDGKRFIVKYKNCLLWHTIVNWCTDPDIPQYFATEVDADGWAKKQLGQEAERIRKWRVV